MLGPDRKGRELETLVLRTAKMNQEDTAAILQMATDVVLLAGPTEDAWSAADGTSAPVRAVTGPDPDSPSDKPPLQESPEDLDPLEGAVDSGAGDSDGSDEHESLLTEFADSELPAAEASIVGAARAGGAPLAARRSRNSALLVLSVILLGVVGSAALGWVDIPWISPEGTPPPVEQDLTSGAQTAVTTNTLAYSIVIGSFEEFSGRHL